MRWRTACGKSEAEDRVDRLGWQDLPYLVNAKDRGLALHASSTMALCLAVRAGPPHTRAELSATRAMGRQGAARDRVGSDMLPTRAPIERYVRTG